MFICLLFCTGRKCNTPIEYCGNNPCQNGGTCKNGAGGAVCQCPTVSVICSAMFNHSSIDSKDL